METPIDAAESICGVIDIPPVGVGLVGKTVAIVPAQK
jgi:hypothetical protein